MNDDQRIFRKKVRPQLLDDRPKPKKKFAYYPDSYDACRDLEGTVLQTPTGPCMCCQVSPGEYKWISLAEGNRCDDSTSPPFNHEGFVHISIFTNSNVER